MAVQKDSKQLFVSLESKHSKNLSFLVFSLNELIKVKCDLFLLEVKKLHSSFPDNLFLITDYKLVIKTKEVSSFPANKCMFKGNNRNTRESLKCVQSYQLRGLNDVKVPCSRMQQNFYG